MAMRPASEDGLRIPLDIGAVDAAWVTEALSFRHPGTEVVSVEVADVIEGSATKVRLRLGYRTETPLPPTMVLKAGFHEGMRQLAAAVYRNEALFFQRIAPHVGIPVPICYYAGCNPDTGQSAVLLEDLDAAGATFGHIARPLTVSAAEGALDLLAGLHATYWNRVGEPPVSELGAVAAGQRFIVDMLVGPENWDRCVELGRFDALPNVVRDRERVASGIAKLLAERVAPGPGRCLVHGDAHLGNVYLAPDGTVRLLDWQAAGPGVWAADVTYFIICALEIEDRRQHGDRLLGVYLDRLAAHGVSDPPALGVALQAHRRHSLYGILGLLCTPEMQNEEFCRVMGSRFAHAIADLGALDQEG